LVLYHLPAVGTAANSLRIRVLLRGARVLDERRAEQGFLLAAWVFLPDHWHALFFTGKLKPRAYYSERLIGGPGVAARR